MYPKGILFDLDDTIISYSPVAEPLWRKLCREFTFRHDSCDAEVLYETLMEISNGYWSDAERHRMGRLNLEAARREVMDLVSARLGLDPAEARSMADAFSVQREEAVHIFDKARETLEHLNQRGVKLAMMTNGHSSKQRAKINRFGLEKYFSAILVEGEMGFGKPDPAVYHRALKALALSPEEVWAVGDNLEWDVAGPQKLGIFGIWNDFANTGLPEDSDIIPDRIINTIYDLVLD
ncbi:MAG: HAD family hydrolase [Desulfobacteraceae bacterium]|nr:HAD family hydrolase [Desulfobacteraceae bacterium]MBU4002538.1 HAD family hydrolase [Pseudomonadota bacterium]MBU4054721.1 HAD family hydrolase [Pseudomonadota bacterium]